MKTRQQLRMTVMTVVGMALLAGCAMAETRFYRIVSSNETRIIRLDTASRGVGWSNSIVPCDFRIEESRDMAHNFWISTLTGTATDVETQVVLPAPKYWLSGVTAYSSQVVPNQTVGLYANDESWPHELLQSCVSDSAGYYAFGGLTNGTYLVHAAATAEYDNNGYEYVDIANADLTFPVGLRKGILIKSDWSLDEYFTPTFTWNSVPLATTYKVELITGYHDVIETLNTSATSYKVSSPVTPFVEYTVFVYAYDGVGNWLGIGILSFIQGVPP